MSTFKFPRSTGSSGAARLSLRQWFDIVVRTKIRKEDPEVVLREYYDPRGIELPINPAQAISAPMQRIERLLATGDKEALELAREYELNLGDDEDGEGEGEETSHEA